MQFPEVRVEIQQQQSYPPHPSYLAATERFRGRATIGADGSLEGYTAGQPFADEQITGARPEVAGYMIAWNQIHRWQYYGYRVDELTMAYLGPTPGGPVLNPDEGLNGGGHLDRLLTLSYHRVYLSKLAMLPEQNYQAKVPDSSTRFFKDRIEFLDPFNVKGTMFVVERMLDLHADDQVNTYLPTERRVRRFSAQERADRFMGSNTTLDDFEGFSGRVLDYKWTYLGKRRVLDIVDPRLPTLQFFGPYSRIPDDRWQLRDCYVVELHSVWEGHPYRSRVMLIDQETFDVAISLVFDHDNRLWMLMDPIYQAAVAADSPGASIENSVPNLRGQVNIDRITDTATIVRARTETGHPTMTPAKIKRIFSVSSLTSGQ
jgi:hypothetical protein